MNSASQGPWLVTGAAGFLGVHLTNQLVERGEKVIGVDNLSRTGLPDHLHTMPHCLSVTDVRDERSVTRLLEYYRPSTVVHLAALHFIPHAVKDPATAISLNVHATQSLLSACRHVGIENFFLASTADVYAPSEQAHTEKDKLAPFNIYGLSKLFCENLVELESKARPSARFTIGRLFNLYGPGETNPHIIPEILQQHFENPDAGLQLGNLFPYRDFVPVADAGRAIIELCSLASNGSTTVNIATGETWQIKVLVQTICRILGSDIEVKSDPKKLRKSERPHLQADVSLLKSLIGWVPHANLEKGLREIIDQESNLRAQAAA